MYSVMSERNNPRTTQRFKRTAGSSTYRKLREKKLYERESQTLKRKTHSKTTARKLSLEKPVITAHEKQTEYTITEHIIYTQ